MLRLMLRGMTIKEKIILNNDLFGYVCNIFIINYIFNLLIYLIYRWIRKTVWERARGMHRCRSKRDCIYICYANNIRIKYYKIYKTVLKN